MLKPRWMLIQEHHERLQTTPKPMQAAASFKQGARRSMRLSVVRIICFVGSYLAAGLAALSVLLDFFPTPPSLTRGLDALQATSSSLTVLFVVGVLVSGRLLRHLEMDLVFYSAETRLVSGDPQAGESSMQT